MKSHPFGCNSAIHFIAVEHGVACRTVFIGPVGEIHTPRKATLGVALGDADDLHLVAAEVEAGKNLARNGLAVIVAPVVLLPRRQLLRKVGCEPAPEVGKVEQALRLTRKVVPRLAAGFLQRGEAYGKTPLVVTYALVLFPFVVTEDERRLVGDLEARLAEFAAGDAPRAAGARGVTQDEAGLLLPVLGKYLPELLAIARMDVVESDL